MNLQIQKSNDLFVIVPTYNEQDIIIQSVVSQLLANKLNVVVVDDGSTKYVQLPGTDDKLHLLRHKINLGQGAALQTGTTYALQKQAKFIVHFDADGQHLIEDIPTLIQPLISQHADIVFGSRFLKAGSNIPIRKKFILHLARYINFIFTGLLLTDAHNGLRALNAVAASQLQITENRMAHASELLFFVKKSKLRLTEVPVHIRYTDYSTKKGQSTWNSIRIFFDLLLHKLFE